jgi:SARP family transcriptional regulator, regulator of embCAB operon
MEFGVLGPFTMNDGGMCRLPSAPKTRQLLALFVLHNNSLTGLDECLEELWGPQGLPSAVQSLHTRVQHIRQALTAVPSIGSQERAKEVLVTRHRGYLLRLEPESVDFHHLERCMETSRRAYAVRDDHGIRSALRTALALWRGPVLADVSHGPVLQAHVIGMEQYRLTLLEQCIEAELRLGMHHELLPELGQLVAEHPTHENFHAQYMIALYRSGRAVHALDMYNALRLRLNNDLGIDPSPRLREIQVAILNSSPVLDVSASQGIRLSLDLLST